LAAKYERHGEGGAGQGRLSTQQRFNRFTKRNWRVLEALRSVSAQVDRPAAQVALAWAAAQRGITSLILGASKLEQLHDNLAALDLSLSAEQLQTLNEISALDPAHPYMIFTAETNRMIFGGASVQGWR